MDQAGIIRDLLSWLESHLDQPLSLDNVAAKAGYSKWHLQRMFKDITGNAIGAYIRARRLSKAAVALRLTSRPILDIALQYRFDSQQTFTRAFKKQFAQTPALYRRAEDWNAFGICPPIRLGAFTLPQPEFVSLPDKHLVGLTQSYSCTLEQITTVRTELRSQFWRQFLGDVETLPPVLYGLHHSRPSQEKDDEQEVLYTTALEPDQVPDKVQEGQPLVLPGGEFAMFSYEGPTENLQDFILTVYGTCLPALQLTRRKGHDIERFYPKGERRPHQAPIEIKCDYLIPIRR
ncbi:MDR efflux pump AcrAB transcriptional activator RobA [Serratia marcescens]|jgi:AraC family transcriptional activator of mar-sox-rob regulon|uniref:DNA-binding transcriptional activator Rob n=3 Tax=Serratia TaxID=613 RepID=A0ABC9IRK6_SERMA|nr:MULTISPECIES: MDR efflux pump AcrAB transcriptional activator RobA [Serratia]QHI76608.1 MDR efflux pump AcrAB transcriptional activator RobA [Serratia sp. NGAS9]ASM24471.1 right oriC-binding transcriptional activator [Serratia marcescens]ASM29249.1 right oriC-binding transcriptional activator [Serratia marcescens]ASM34022.1 right oriC-binding transcriptional activator [Serratia marcescens]AVU28983.1 MDR efflux pump AcrAB transcriptional activator RobA [Serratia marcescens]